MEPNLEIEALRAIRDEAYRQRIHCAVSGHVPESVLTLWNLARFYLGETGPNATVIHQPPPKGTP